MNRKWQSDENEFDMKREYERQMAAEINGEDYRYPIFQAMDALSPELHEKMLKNGMFWF